MRPIRRLFHVLNEWKGRYAAAGVFLVTSSLVWMLEPKVLQLAVDNVVYALNKKPTTEEAPDIMAQWMGSFLPAVSTENVGYVLLLLGLIFVLIAGVEALTRFLASALAAHSTESATKALRRSLFDHIQALSITEMDRIPKADMIQRCTGDVETVRTFLNNQVTELLRLAAILVGAFTLMAMVHLGYAFLSVAFFIPIVLTSFFFFKKEGDMWQAHEKEQDKLTDIIQENLSGIRVVQAFAQEEKELKRFTEQNTAKRTIGVKHVDLHTRFWPISDGLINLQIALSLFAGAYFAMNGSITVGEYATFFTYSVIITWPMRNLGQITSRMGMAVVAMERIGQILDAKEEDYQEEEDWIGEKIQGEIEFRNVTFSYPNADKKALDKVSFQIRAGEQIAFMGGTGAGKTTIIHLLLRFYEPQEGEILLDGKPLTSYPKTMLRKAIGLVHQKPFLFSTTVEANIRYARPDIVWQDEGGSNTLVDEVSKAAHVTDFIHKLHKGWNTIVGEKGVALSGGQKQRVTLARALMTDFDMLILDDATSAVDTETEYGMQKALKSYTQNKTTIIVSHRLTSVQHADRIIVLEKGQILEQGTHQELLELEGGFYSQTYEIQVAIEDDLK